MHPSGIGELEEAVGVVGGDWAVVVDKVLEVEAEVCRGREVELRRPTAKHDRLPILVK